MKCEQKNYGYIYLYIWWYNELRRHKQIWHLLFLTLTEYHQWSMHVNIQRGVLISIQYFAPSQYSFFKHLIFLVASVHKLLFKTVATGIHYDNKTWRWGEGGWFFIKSKKIMKTIHMNLRVMKKWRQNNEPLLRDIRQNEKEETT